MFKYIVVVFAMLLALAVAAPSVISPLVIPGPGVVRVVGPVVGPHLISPVAHLGPVVAGPGHIVLG